MEDISSPRCFEIERRLKEELDIPVMHDDQHGTAIVTLAGLTNALKIVGKKLEDVQIVVSGPGAAGTAVMKLLLLAGAKHIIACDSRGIISSVRDNLDDHKNHILSFTNKRNIHGGLKEAIVGADVFIGLSAPEVLNRHDIATMAKDPIIFAMANPTPEIMPDEAYAGGARIVATGRSDFPNQVNNVLAFPGIFKGCFKYGKKKITEEMKLAAAYALAGAVKNPTEQKIIPNPFDPGIADMVADAMKDL